ncbi:hypothetical protein LDENG_00168240, partial [Lucifuga dentata]
VNVCSYLQLVCLAEKEQVDLDDALSLLRLCHGDIRRCLLQLQLWVLSSRGRASQRIDSSVTAREDGLALPPCDAGCTVSMLGLKPVTKNYLLNFLKCPSWPDADMQNLLADSWRRGEPLLYSNLELLLPIRATETQPVHKQLGKESGSVQQDELVSSDNHSHIQRLHGKGQLKATATNGNKFRNVSRLSRKKHIPTLTDATSASNMKPNLYRSSLSFKGTYSGAMCTNIIKQNAAKVESHCLDALTEFFDLMSYLDAIMPGASPHVSGPCRPEEFAWTGAEIKDGLLDEMREEDCRSWSPERLQEIQASAEGLGCHRCWWQLSEAWTEARGCRQEVEDMHPVSSDRQSLSFCFQPLCEPSAAERRWELSRLSGSCSFSLVGSRHAVRGDYMPVVRSICRSDGAQRRGHQTTRCLNYISRLDLSFSKSTIQLLTHDFS